MHMTRCVLLLWPSSTTSFSAACKATLLGAQVTKVEFALLWATYLAIMYSDLERGIGAGIVMATLYFAYSYAQVRRIQSRQLALPYAALRPALGPLQLENRHKPLLHVQG